MYTEKNNPLKKHSLKTLRVCISAEDHEALLLKAKKEGFTLQNTLMFLIKNYIKEP